MNEEKLSFVNSKLFPLKLTALWQHACDYQMSMEPTFDLTDSEIRPVTKYRRRSSTAPTLGVRALLHGKY